MNNDKQLIEDFIRYLNLSITVDEIDRFFLSPHYYPNTETPTKETAEKE